MKEDVEKAVALLADRINRSVPSKDVLELSQALKVLVETYKLFAPETKYTVTEDYGPNPPTYPHHYSFGKVK
jgi:hypothetical protein